jgi:hypothetical protein
VGVGGALNVIESWNRANTVMRYGNQGEFATNRRDQQEMAVLCLRILQAALVYVNTCCSRICWVTQVGGHPHRRGPAGAHPH